MSDIPHAHIRQRMAKLALAIVKGGETEPEKMRLMGLAFEAEADRLVLMGMDQTILAANRRKAQIKGGGK